jgi:hypothetical protein
VFGAVVRIAIGFAGMMLLLTVLQETVGAEMLPIIKNGAGVSGGVPNSTIVTALEGTLEFGAVIAFVTAALALIARGLSEARLG